MAVNTAREDLELIAISANERAELLRAQLNAAISSLREVVGIITRAGGYMTPEHQHRYRHARGLLAEHGVTLLED